MARKAPSENETARGRWRHRARLVLLWTSIAAVGVLAVVVYYRSQNFLVTDGRFRLGGSTDLDGDIPGVRVDGIVHCSPARVLGVFNPDFGRSVYLIPLEERRRNLLSLDWVKDASVSRLWPNQVQVRITERVPVAFVQIPSTMHGGSFQVALIDEDGVLLDPPPRARFALPVLTGIRREQSRETRRDRVRAALRLVAQLGGMSDRISEIDVLDPENLKITQPLDGRAIVLMLGSQNFLARLQNFLNHYPEIHKRLEHATMFDLRLDDRITAVEEGRAGG